MSNYRKTAAAVIGASLVWAQAYEVLPSKWLALATALAAALGVYGVTNDKKVAK